ncbi:MAG: DUF86 domain-containing protein [Planctomycetota bacterium]
MPKRGDIEFLSDISEAIKRIGTYTAKMSYDGFLEDKKTQDAVVRNIEILGEAVKNISDALKADNPQIGWKDIAGMRDKIIHFYFGIRWATVWSAIKNEIPDLKIKIEGIIGKTGV